jgi:SAM-dependent methyltransferase
MQEYYKKILKNYLPSDLNASILEIGCGKGYALEALENLGYSNVEGIEIDESQFESCLSKGLNVHLVDDTIDYLGKIENKFSLVILFDVLEHIPVNEQFKFCTKIVNSLTEVGILVCTVPNANSSIAMRWRYNDFTHHSSFTEHSLDFLLFNSGFQKIDIKEIEFFKKPIGILNPFKFVKRAHIKAVVHWWQFKINRFIRRQEVMAELGWGQGRVVPLSLNIFCVARK